MCADNFELDPDDHFNETCGKILSTSKGLFVFICALCDRKYLFCENLLAHYSQEHVLLEESKANIDLFSTPPEAGTSNDETNLKSGGTDVQRLSIRLGQNDPLAVNLNNGSCDPDDLKEEPYYEEDAYSSSRHQTNDVAPTKPEQELSSEAVKGYFTVTIPNQMSEDEKSTEEKSEEKETCHEKKVNFLENAQENSELQLSRKKQRAQDSRLFKNVHKRPKLRKVDKRRQVAEETVLQSITVTKQIRCLKCPIIFMEENEFREHLKEHETYTCSKCTISFLSKHKFESHCRLECTVLSRPLKCYLCGFGVRHRNELRCHLERHFRLDQLQCKECPAKFESMIVLQAHMRHSHFGKERHECPICGAGILRKSNLKKHILTHSEENKTIECKDCPKKFLQRSSLKKHFLRVHSNERPHLCSECGACYATLALLNQHTKKRHTFKEKNIKCEICAKMFCFKNQLTRHMLVHSDERTHVCSFCNRGFKKRSTLVQHVKIHENKRTYQCELCQKGFNQRPALTSHMKSHM